MTVTGERFNVVLWDADGYWHYARENVPAERAVEIAHTYVTIAETDDELIDRVMITDSGDHTNFLWQRGKGIVFPEREETP